MSQMKATVSRLAVLLFVLNLPTALHAQSADVEQEFDVAAGGTLIINSDSGAIEVNTWDQNRVRVRIRNTDGFDVELEQQGNDVVVVADSRGGRGFFGIRRSNIGFRADVPVNYNVELDTGGGRIEVSDINGEVDVDTSGGQIDIGRVTGGDVRADTSGGSINIEYVDGDVVADTSGGNITIGDVTGDASADTSGGRINIGNVAGDMLADTSGGNIDVGEGGGRVELDTSGGTIRAAWARGAISADTSGGNIFLAGSDVSVEADTSGGNIVIEGSNGPVNADTSGGHITISGVTGPVRADTSGGNIDVDFSAVSGRIGGDVELDTAGGDITLRIPASLPATIRADLQVSRRGRGDYRIYTDFPLTITEEDRLIMGRGDINGGGDRIVMQTTNSDIRIISVGN